MGTPNNKKLICITKMGGSGGRQRRKKNTSKNKQYGRARTKGTYKRDIDQIILHDMIAENTSKLLTQPINEDKPGLGQHYCVPCARYFISQAGLHTHLKSKQHKKRFKVVTTEKPYTIEEAERAGGLWKPPTKKESGMPDNVRF